MLVLCLFAIPSSLVLAAGSPDRGVIPQEVLLEILQQQQKIAFVGIRTQTVFSGDPEEEDLVIRQRILHAPPDEYRIEYLDRPEGEESYVLTKGEQLFQWVTGGHVHISERSPNQTLGLVISDTYLDLLRKNYFIRAEDGEKVAGRSTYEVRIDPHYAGRPSIRAWIDSTYGVPLKLEKYDSRGELQIKFEYQRIGFRARLRVESFSLPEGAETVTEVRGTEYATPGEFLRETERHAPLSNMLPAGFTLVKIRKGRSRGQEYLQSVYSDGYASLSIFAVTDPDNAPEDRDKPGLHDIRSGSRLGSAYATGWIGEVRVTIMGDVAESELVKLLSTVQLTGNVP
ncbi:sigma-E factor regulatory protein RseB domain-containing protein [Gemmatimonadota bacterium]